MEAVMFWAVCSFTLGALLGDYWGILLVSCLYALLKPQPVGEPVYYLSPDGLHPLPPPGDSKEETCKWTYFYLNADTCSPC